MQKWLNWLYQKNPLYFSLLCIGVYCFANSLGNLISDKIGINSSVTCVVNILLSIALLQWIRRNGLMTSFGLCGSSVPASKFLWYLPLGLFASTNLWLGVGSNLPPLDTVCYILSMLCVGFLEEVIFRGFLFKALAKENVKTAMIISSVTFGIGHILNLFNGSGMELLDNLCQVIAAIACGFLFVTIFHRGGSLIPCILAHGINNAVSVFSNEAAVTFQRELLLYAAVLLIATTYCALLRRTLPQK